MPRLSRQAGREGGSREGRNRLSLLCVPCRPSVGGMKATCLGKGKLGPELMNSPRNALTDMARKNTESAPHDPFESTCKINHHTR